MAQKISMLGCGWLGLPLAIDLINKGYEVYGSTTSASKINDLTENGIKPFLIDIGNINTDLRDFLTSEVLIIAITSKNIDDIRNLITHIEASEVKKVLFISSTSVYPFTNGIVTEETNTLDTPLAQIERLFITNSSFKSTILRFGGLFGYNRKPGNFIRTHKQVDNPEGYINFIHRDDCIQIIEQIIIKNVWNEILNACADEHPKRREFYLQEIQKVGISAVVFNENSKNEYKIINSQKMKILLNYEFIHGKLMDISE
ncbi:NAD(P)-binding domain-containing protein [Plebeiibacterium sediminum]|uniref:NAD(P)-binding domain-containing protein n=1 Tax=Plebeiibacterium sediminum TaxID=2992112 RepID=A0AAE3M7Z6_9BACT|nr:NAD(P)H-binding protein [Plebeiobacterium sediminum]MCW3788661.1 NAD(P)-binding domain-containing protein [Plebeiobacterium sediminum]